MKQILDTFTTLFDFEFDKKELENLERSIESVKNTSYAAAKGISMIKGALLAFGSYFAVHEVNKYANEYDNLINKLKTTGIAGEKLHQVFSSLSESSKETGVGIDSMAELYQKLDIGIGNIVSSDNLTQISDTIAKMFALGGTDASHQKFALEDLSRGLESATVNWREIKNAMLDVPYLNKVINESFNSMGTTAQEALKGGTFATKDFVNILMQSSKKVDEEFSKMKRTIPMALGSLETSLISFFGTLRDESGATGFLVSAFDYISDGISNLNEYLSKHKTLIQAASIVIVTVLSAIAVCVLILDGALWTLMANPVVLFIAGIIAVITVLTLIVEDFLVYMKGGRSLIGDIIDYWSKKFNALPGPIKAIFQTIGGMIKLWFDGMKMLVNELISFITHPIDYVMNKFNALISWIKSTAIGKYIANKLGFDLGDMKKSMVHTVNHHASMVGFGNLTNGMAMAGLPTSNTGQTFHDNSTINFEIHSNEDSKKIANDVAKKINDHKNSYRMAVQNHDSAHKI